jgi:hypothetical protein
MISVPRTSDVVSVTDSAADFDTALDVETAYVLISDVACWVAQGASPTASAADGSVLVPAGSPLYLHGRNGDSVSVIRDTTSGSASLAVATPW